MAKEEGWLRFSSCLLCSLWLGFLGYFGGYYVAQDDYNYYFREGFRRGYEDGYNNRYQYGRYSGGNYTIPGALSALILGLQALP